MNILAVTVLVICVNTYGVAMFDLSTFPDWAASGASPTPTTISGNVTRVCRDVASSQDRFLDAQLYQSSIKDWKGTYLLTLLLSAFTKKRCYFFSLILQFALLVQDCFKSRYTKCVNRHFISCLSSDDYILLFFLSENNKQERLNFQNSTNLAYELIPVAQ